MAYKQDILHVYCAGVEVLVLFGPNPDRFTNTLTDDAFSLPGYKAYEML